MGIQSQSLAVDVGPSSREGWLLDAVVRDIELLHLVIERLAQLQFAHEPFYRLASGILAIMAEDDLYPDMRAQLSARGLMPIAIEAMTASVPLIPAVVPTAASWLRMADVQMRTTGRALAIEASARAIEGEMVDELFG